MTRGPLITGEMIRLRPVESRDADGLWAGMQDNQARRLAGFTSTPTRDDVEAWAGTISNEPERYDYTITSLDSDELIGEIVLDRLHPVSKRARLHMTMLPGCRGRGYGREAIFRILELAFAPEPTGLGLHRVGIYIPGINQRAAQIYEFFGFRSEGTLRDYYADEEGYSDAQLMSLLAEEFEPESAIYQPNSALAGVG